MSDGGIRPLVQKMPQPAYSGGGASSVTVSTETGESTAVTGMDLTEAGVVIPLMTDATGKQIVRELRLLRRAVAKLTEELTE